MRWHRYGVGAVALPFLFSTLMASGCSVLFSDSTTGPGGSDQAICSTLAPLRDDFSSTELRLEWLLDLDSTELISYGQGEGEGAVFESTNPNPSHFSALVSRYEHDLTDNAFTVEVDEIAPNGRTFISLFSEPGNRPPTVSMSLQDGELSFTVNGTPQGVADFDATRDKIWRIREEGGTLYFETGPSAGEMTVHSETIALGEFDPSQVRATLGLAGGNETPERTVVSGVNLEASPTTYCSAHSFVDSFADGELDPSWRVARGSDRCASEAVGDELKVTLLNPSAICGLETLRGFSLIESSIELRFDPPLSLETGVVSLRLERSEADSIEVFSDGETARTSLSIDDDLRTTPDELAPLVTRLRLLSEGDRVRWEVETDGVVVVLEDQPIPFSLNGLRAAILFESSGEGTSVTVGGLNAD